MVNFFLAQKNIGQKYLVGIFFERKGKVKIIGLEIFLGKKNVRQKLFRVKKNEGQKFFCVKEIWVGIFFV